MERKAAEFERKAEELGASIKELMLELQEINKESESITDQIQAAEERQKELAAPAKVFMDSGSMVAEQAFQIFEVDQNMIQSNQQGSEQTEMEKMKETLENIQRKFSEVGDDITSSIK
jgi:predicted  nucleic acid-binding Zn-ribbon protein